MIKETIRGEETYKKNLLIVNYDFHSNQYKNT